MHLMWSMLNTLQLIMFILKYNILVPPNAYLFFKNVEEFLGMKAEFIDSMLESLQSKLSKNDNGVNIKAGDIIGGLSRLAPDYELVWGTETPG